MFQCCTGSLSNIMSECEMGSALNSRLGSLSYESNLKRTGSMPTLKISSPIYTLKQTAFYLTTITINDDPFKLIKEKNPDLKLNGFSVTLEELATMFQVGLSLKGKAMVEINHQQM